MSRNHFNELSPCEALIMKLIWEAPQDIPVQDLIDQLRDDYKKEYARTTVVTFVGKLKDKRFVDTYRKGKAAFIHPLRTEDEYRAQLLKEEADFWFNGNVFDMVAAILQSQELTLKKPVKVDKIWQNASLTYQKQNGLKSVIVTKDSSEYGRLKRHMARLQVKVCLTF